MFNNNILFHFNFDCREGSQKQYKNCGRCNLVVFGNSNDSRIRRQISGNFRRPDYWCSSDVRRCRYVRNLYCICCILVYSRIIKRKQRFETTLDLMNKIINTSAAPKAVGPYSQAVVSNGLLFISGQLGIDPVTGKMVEGGVTEQTQQVMKNIGAILREAGYDYKDVIKSTCFLSDMNNFAAMNSVYGSFYPENPPARAAIAVAGLPLGALIEIETIAGR